jgi:hypothetical protein
VVPANLHYTNLNLRLNRADGAVVWLNGRELVRVNLPPWPVSFLDLATVALSGDPLHIYYPTNVPMAFLPAGTNVVAVEVHKFSPSRPNLTFDLELFGLGEFAPPPPPLAASLDGSDLCLRWPATNNTGFILVSGTNLSWNCAWSPVGGPYLLEGGFYEYREPLIQPPAANFYLLRYVGLPAKGPKLGWMPGSNVLGLSWTVDFAGFNLETSTNLSPTDAWRTVAGPYALTNGRFQVSTPRTSAYQQFFRLKKPLP